MILRYIVDGNALFLTATEASWRTASSPHYQGGGIVVAVGYVLQGKVFDRNRGYDLTPRTPGATGESGGADAFLDFILESVRPMVARCFPHTTFTRKALYGHSYGGLFALNALLTRPDSFDLFIASSPSAWFQGGWIIEEAKRFANAKAVGLGVGQTNPSLMFLSGSLEQYPRRWHDEPLEDFEKRQKSCAELKMSDNAQELRDILQSSGRLAAVSLDEYTGEDHGTVMACTLSRSLTTFFDEWPL